MALKLIPKFTQAQVHEKMVKEKTVLRNATLLRLSRIGEQFVIDARSKTAAQGGFNDRTGNLRNSIGYVILEDGKTIRQNFKSTAKPTVSGGTKEGLQQGATFAAEVARGFPTGIVLIVVAGMEYAAAVELRGKDVITGSSVEAQKSLIQAIVDLRTKLAKKSV